MEGCRAYQDLQASEAAKDTVTPTPEPDKGTLGTLRREVDSLPRENARVGKMLERARERKVELVSLRKPPACARR